MFGRKKDDVPLRADLAEKAGPRGVKLAGKALRAAEGVMSPDEPVRAAHGSAYALVLTDRRIIHAVKDMFTEAVDVTPLDQVSTVQFSGRGPLVDLTVLKSGSQLDYPKVSREFAAAVQAAASA